MGKPAATENYEDSRDFVQSLARGLTVLRSFDSSHPKMTLAAVSNRTGLPRAACRRLLLTLCHLGYMRQSGREFSLRGRVLELGFAYLGSLNLTEFAQPILEELAHQVGESCSLATLDGQDIVYVVRVPLRRVMSTSLAVGARLPAAAASMGRVLLSGLNAPQLRQWLLAWRPAALTRHTVTDRGRLLTLIDEVRAQGYAYVEQELESGLCSIAVPVRNRHRQIVLALNASMAYHPDVRQHAVETVLPRLLAAATAIEAGAVVMDLAEITL